MQDNLQSELIEITIEITGADLSREIRYHADEYDQENLVFLTKLIQKLVFFDQDNLFKWYDQVNLVIDTFWPILIRQSDELNLFISIDQLFLVYLTKSGMRVLTLPGNLGYITWPVGPLRATWHHDVAPAWT